MSGFLTERERAAETGFVHEEELRFLAHRRATHSLGVWAAQCMGYDAIRAGTYESGLVDAVIAGLSYDGLLAKVQTDLERAGKPSLTAQVAPTFSQALAQATEELRGRPASTAKSEDPLDSFERRHPKQTAWGSLRF